MPGFSPASIPTKFISYFDSSEHLVHIDSISMLLPFVAVLIAIKIASRSMFTIAHGSLIFGIQLLIMSATASPLNSASGVLAVISSIAVIGKTGNSLLSGIDTVEEL